MLKKYLTNKEKYYFVRRIAIVSFVFFVLVLFLIPFLLPSRTYALGVEPVWQTLSSADGIGGQVQKVWRSLITAVNSLAVIILIVIAFSEILRINVNTYGVKKILPTLVLAIIAANFSYIFCRLMVDLANISLQFIGSVGGSSGIALEAPRDFNWDTTKGWWELFFNNLLLQNILLFILAILLLCLAFLFLVRNWMLYILVMLSPLAIMAMVLPSTKKYFTQWWTNMIQWSFMPVASYFFLALSVTFGTQIGSTAPLMGTVFVGVCYYLAITTPFKLGGTVMQNFYKMTGAKHLAGKTADYAKTSAGNLGKEAWRRYLKFGLDAQRGPNNPDANILSKTKLGQWMGGHWIGTGLMKAKGRDKELEADLAGIVEGVQGRDLANQGRQMVNRRLYRQNRQGEIKEYESKALKQMLEDGIKARQNGGSDKDFERLIRYKLGSGATKREIATVESMLASMLSDGVTSSIEGRLVDRTSARESRISDIDTEIKNLEEDDTLRPEEKKDKIEKLAAERKKLKSETRKQWQQITGMSDSDIDTLQSLMEEAVTGESVATSLQTKAENDLRDKSAMQIVAIHELQDMAEEVEKTKKAFEALPVAAQDLFKNIKNGTKSIDSLTDSERELYDTHKNGIERLQTQSARAETLLRQQGIITANKKYDGDDKEIYDDAIKKRDGYASALGKKFEKSGGIPYYLRNLVSRNEDGSYSLHKLQRTAYTRFQGVANAKTNGRVEGYSALQTDALLSILQNGDLKDGITAEMAQAFMNGKLVLNDDKLPDSNKNSRLSAAWAAIGRQLDKSTTAESATRGLITIYNKEKLQQIANDWIESEGGRDINTTGTNKNEFAALRQAAANGNHKELQESMCAFYRKVSPNMRSNIHGALRRFLPETNYS